MTLKIFYHYSLFSILPADSFVNSAEWTMSKAVPDLRLVSTVRASACVSLPVLVVAFVGDDWSG